MARSADAFHSLAPSFHEKGALRSPMQPGASKLEVFSAQVFCALLQREDLATEHVISDVDSIRALAAASVGAAKFLLNALDEKGEV